MNNIILTESDIHRIIRESVKKILKESYMDDDNYYYNDAIEALQTSDGFLDFEVWYPAFQDELEPDQAEEIFNKALQNWQNY
jgi:hypothetical protein